MEQTILIRFNKVKKTFLLCFILLSTTFVYSQNAPITTAASNTNATANASITVPVTVTGFLNVGQFTLTIIFDTTKVRYVSSIANASLTGMAITYTHPSGNTQGKIIMTWTGATNTSLANGATLASLTFTYVASTGILNWAYTYGSVCQYKTYISGVLTAMNDNPQYSYYINGGIANRAAPVTTAPAISNPVAGTVQVPIIVYSGFTSIGAVTLYLEYDTTIVTYLNTFTKNASFNSSFLVGNVAGTGSKKMIVIQWYGGGVTLANGSTICTLNFTYIANGTTTALRWFENGPSCEYADATGNVLIDTPTSSYYNNGVIGPALKLKGQLSYNNTAVTPINGANIQLLNSFNAVIATTTTYSDSTIPTSPVPGYFQFNNLTNSGSYKIRVINSITWGGVNATDALLIKRHTVGLTTLTNLPLVAADVNLSNSVNSTDALLIQLRNIGSINQFTAGDWVYSDSSVNLLGTTTHNISALCSGDVNQSYTPLSLKTAMNKNLLKEGILFADKSSVIEIPIRVNEIVSLGAVTLEMLYNKDLIEVEDINSQLKDYNYSISDGIMRFVWSDEKTATLKENDVLLNLRIRIKRNISSTTDLLSYTHNTEFADGEGHIINLSNLKVSSIETNSRENAISAYPNPMKDNVTIEYNLNESGTINMTCYNIVGQRIDIITNEYKSEGAYILNINTSMLPTGIYTYEITFEGKTTKFKKTIKELKIKN